MEHPCRAARDPLKGATPAVRQSRPGGVLGGTVSRRALGTGSPRGFTLIELLVAIAVMSMLAVLSWRSLDGMNRAQTFTQQRADQLLRLQAALGQWSADLDAIINTREVQPLEFDGRLLRLTRRDSSETGLDSPGMRVVAWTRFDGTNTGGATGQWMRWQSGPISHRDDLARAWERAADWSQRARSAPDQVIFGESAVPVIGIENWQLFYHRGETWGNPLSSVGNPGLDGQGLALSNLPDGVRLVLTLAPSQGLTGTLVRDWVRPTMEAGRQ
jgi:general secretion pathway protein J